MRSPGGNTAASSTDLRFIPIQHTKNPREWLLQRLPKLNLRAVVRFDHTTYLAVVPRQHEEQLVQTLLEGIEPPLQRRLVNGKVSSDPAIDFLFDFHPQDARQRAKLQHLMRGTLLRLTGGDDYQMDTNTAKSS